MVNIIVFYIIVYDIALLFFKSLDSDIIISYNRKDYVYSFIK